MKRQKALLFASTANEPYQAQAPKGEVIGLGGIEAAARTVSTSYSEDENSIAVFHHKPMTLLFYKLLKAK